jgi:hypothetical protein
VKNLSCHVWICILPSSDLHRHLPCRRFF